MLRTAIAGFVGVLVGAAVVGLGIGQQQEAPAAKPVRAERFEPVDAKGKARGALRFSVGGGPELELRDESGKVRAVLSLLPDGSPSLNLWDENEKVRAGLGLTEDGTPGLDLYDGNGKVLWSAP